MFRTSWSTPALVASAILTSACGSTGGGHAAGHHAATRAGEPADASEADRTIAVDALDAMAFDPAELEVDAGETITFVVTNVGGAVHEFTLGDPAMQDEHAGRMADGGGMDHDQPNSVTLPPGGTRELTWRFPEGGTVEYACHQPGHYDAGMRGSIDVD